MSKHGRKKRRDYQAEVLRQARAALADGSLQRGRVYQIVVCHDDSCSFPIGRGRAPAPPRSDRRYRWIRRGDRGGR